MGWKGRLGEAVLGLQSAGMRGRSTTGEGQHLRATAGTTAGDRGRGAASLFMSDVLGPGIWVLGSYGHVFIGLSFKPSFVYSTFFSPLRARSLRHFTTLHSAVLASSFFTN